METEKKAFIKNAASQKSSIRNENGIISYKKGKIPYVPCSLIKNNGKHGWYIEFKYINPKTGELTRGVRRVKKEFNLCETEKQAEALIKERIINPLNKQLESGWTPKGDLIEDNPKEENISHLLILFMQDKQDLRRDTIRVYRSATKYLSEFLKTSGLTKLNVKDFGEYQAMQLRKFAKKKGLEGVTFNNYRRMWGNFFGWIAKSERINLPYNPITYYIEKEKENYSPRDTVSHDKDLDIQRWCENNDPVLLLLISLISGPSFLRIQEILRLKVGDIDFKENRIKIDQWQSKTKSSIKILGEDSKKLMLELGIDQLPANFFMIGKEQSRFGKLLVGKASKNSIYSKEDKKKMASINNKSFREIETELSRDGYLLTRDVDKNWEKLREAVNLPKSCQLYSYRHRAISDLYAIGYSRDQITQLTGHVSDAFWHYVSSAAKGSVAEMIAQKCISVISK
ncbi:tyrosine-type recombinase/integrase [Bacteroides sp.]|uniref:tyrosine-type recombinase/integrase n=1 Tax=Bacteroides sp. TaxID=29523 RepID=UPI00262E5334|nr:tyrosine-type recombinase/integrase [Bacteroides sp.]MDD3038905.1 tyrosine-type recombinase/integrase [Bacteroides sp.]